MTDSTQLFVATIDNAAQAHLMGDALAGGGEFGCMCHFLSLIIKIVVFKGYNIGIRMQYMLKKIRNLGVFLSRHKLHSALEHAQVSLGTNNQNFWQLQEVKSKRWYSTLIIQELYEAFAPAIALMEADGVVSWGSSVLLTASELFDVRSIITVLNILRAASLQFDVSKTLRTYYRLHA